MGPIWQRKFTLQPTGFFCFLWAPTFFSFWIFYFPLIRLKWSGLLPLFLPSDCQNDNVITFKGFSTCRVCLCYTGRVNIDDNWLRKSISLTYLWPYFGLHTTQNHFKSVFTGISILNCFIDFNLYLPFLNSF